MMKQRIETVIEDRAEYVYSITGTPTKFLDIEEQGIGVKIPIATPNLKAHQGLSMLRKKSFVYSVLGIVLLFIVMLVGIGYGIYTGSLNYSTTTFSEDDFTLIYSEGTVLQVESQDDIMAAINSGSDMSEFSSATIIYSGVPTLIGYKIDIQNPEVLLVSGGKIYGISEGSSSIYLYSQDGTYLTTRRIFVEG